MKQFASYTGVFVVGFLTCVVALKTLGDSPSAFSFGVNAKSKQAVLTALNTTPAPMRRAVGDSVVADAAAKLEPSVVTVHTVGRVVQSSNPFGGDPIFRQFFGGGGQAQPTPEMGAGSGIIISPDGYILTNNHVVANTSKVTVNVGNNGKAYDARVIGTDPIADIAVIKVDTQGQPLKAAVLGNSSDVRIGDWAIAVGNPLDVGETVTLGIVSALGRTGRAEGSQSILPAIQTDAAINPGNSGGALANINGQVIGINEAILSPSGTYSGIGFAIPINRAKEIAAELIKTGKATHPYLGVAFGDVGMVSPDQRQQIGIPASLDYGVIVSHVYPNTPAAEAGLHMFDVILSANGERITSSDQLNGIVQTAGIGSKLTLQVMRDGQSRTVATTLRERPASFGVPRPQPQGQGQPQEQGPQGFPFPLP